MKMPEKELQKVSDILAGMAKAKPSMDKRPAMHAPSEMDCPYCQGEGCKKCEDGSEEEDVDEEGGLQKEALNKVIVILLDGSEEEE